MRLARIVFNPIVGCFLVLMLVVFSVADAQQASETTEEILEKLKAKLSLSTQVETKELEEIIRVGQAGYERISKIPDYSCLLIKHERVEGRLGGYQYMFLKIRHEQKEGDKITVPFSVYVKFLKPVSIKDREVIYVKGKNQGDVIARRGGRRNPHMTVQLDPKSPLAMSGQRYPITQIGFLSLVSELLGAMKKEKAGDGLAVRVYQNAKLNDRKCTHYELLHTKHVPGQEYQKAQLFVDDELRVPVYFASYAWPEKEGDEPVLLEEYTYTRLKLNIGLTDKDFDPKNPEYGFKEIEDLPPDASPE